MGRFQYHEDKNDDENSGNGEPNGQRSSGWNWNFVALPGEEEALVPRHDDDNEHDESAFSEQNGLEERLGRTVFVIYPRHGEDFDNDARTSNRTSCRCPLWLRITLLALLCQIAWYALHEGPPAPPVSLMNGDSSSFEAAGDDVDVIPNTTWNEYLHNHTDNLVRSATALFVELPYHIVSWWSLHVHSNLQEMYQEWTTPRPCTLNWNGGRIADDQSAMEQGFSQCFAAQSQPVAFSKFMEAFSAWRRWNNDNNNAKKSPLVLLASSMTPGLVSEGLGKCLVERLLDPTCTKNPPIATVKLRKNSSVDSTALLRDKLLEILTPWKGQGGLVVLSSVEHIPAESLEWLLGILTGESNNNKTDQQWVESLASRVVFILASEEIGRPSLIRHMRMGGGQASLVLDLKHDWGDRGALWDMGATVLPLFAISREQVKMFVGMRLQEILDWNVLVVPSEETETLIPQQADPLQRRTLFVGSIVVELLTSPDIVEYLDWSTNVDGQEQHVMTFSSTGVDPVEEKLRWLVARLDNCFEDLQDKNLLVFMSYEKSLLFLKRCETVWLSSCVAVCSFPVG